MNPTDLVDKSDLFPDNLANPEGFFGDVVGSYISFVFEPLNQWAIDLIKIQPGENVLEIGFGPGLAIQKMISDTPVGHIVGIDNSALMVQKATNLNLQVIQEGKVTLMHADVCQLPPFDRKFDKIIAINTTMYWPYKQLEVLFKNLRKCLVPGGSFFIILQRLYAEYERGDRSQELQGYLKLLQNAGFLDVRGAVQGVADKEAAIASGVSIGIALYGSNPVFSL